MRVLDIFCGCGGLSYGFQQAEFEIVAGVDYCKDALLTFSKNHNDAESLLIDLSNYDLFKFSQDLQGKIDVVIGGPPCQGFSISGKRDPNDPRNQLYKSFLYLVNALQPKAFVMENVPNLVSMQRGKIKEQIIRDFQDLGYQVYCQILLASNYGVPQNRKRVFFVGVPQGYNYYFPAVSYIDNQVTCSEAISDLSELTIQDGEAYPSYPLSPYQKFMRQNSDKVYNHIITNHSQKTIDTIALVPDGGNYKNLPQHLQSTRKVNIAWTRYASNKPSLTIDTGHRHHFHYKFNRVLTVRESARLQSFPDDFIFYGSKTSQYKQVGNAVPPLLAKEVALSLTKCLHHQNEPSYQLSDPIQLSLPFTSY